MSRRRYLQRCTACDGVTAPAEASRYPCPKCGQWSRVSLPADEVAEQQEAEPRRLMVMTDLYMDGVAATDGTDIGSRRKRNAYKKANGLADFDDFTGSWEKAAKERKADHVREIRDEIGRTAYELKERNRGRR